MHLFAPPPKTGPVRPVRGLGGVPEELTDVGIGSPIFDSAPNPPDR